MYAIRSYYENDSREFRQLHHGPPCRRTTVRSESEVEAGHGPLVVVVEPEVAIFELGRLVLVAEQDAVLLPLADGPCEVGLQ